MDYEEKYKAALERARQFGEHSLQGDSADIVECIFPELQGNNDERIRKELITHCRNTRCVTEEGAERIAKWVAWLEKQGEQNFADKIEPKFNFKVGQWIVATGKRVYLIAKIDGFNVTLVDTNGDKYVFHVSSLVDAYQWTIADAKDGDVLAVEDKNFTIPFIAIYKSLGRDNLTFNLHCFIGFDRNFYEDEDGHTIEGIHPATKEQRDLLFRNMKEAGYDWDADKKELKKMEVASKESEDERTRKAILTGLIDCRDAPDLGWSHFGGVNIDDCIAWLEKQGKQKTDPCTDCTNDKGCVTCENGNLKETKIGPKFKAGDEVYNKFDKSLGHVVIESVDDTTYYGDTTNFDITDQDQWGIVRSCENCKCGYYSCKSYPTVSCYLHEDCGGDGPIIISDDDFVETAMTCKEFEREN